MLFSKTFLLRAYTNFNSFFHIYSFQHTKGKKNPQENIAGKGEIAQNEQFHLFPQRLPCNLYLKIL